MFPILLLNKVHWYIFIEECPDWFIVKEDHLRIQMKNESFFPKNQVEREYVAVILKGAFLLKNAEKLIDFYGKTLIWNIGWVEKSPLPSRLINCRISTLTQQENLFPNWLTVDLWNLLKIFFFFQLVLFLEKDWRLFFK